MAGAIRPGTRINIREVTDEDVEAILAIDRKIVGAERAITYRDPIDFYLGGEYSLSVVAEVKRKIVGFALARLRGRDIGWLQAVAVDPDYRHLGIGSKLINAVADRCRSKGANALHTAARWRDSSMLSFLSSMEFERGEMVDLKKML